MKETVYLGILTIGLAIACSGNVRAPRFRENEFPKYSRFAFLPSGDTMNTKLNEQASRAVLHKVHRELSAHGYSLDPGEPDFLVLLHTNFNLALEIGELPPTYVYYGPGFYPGPFFEEFYYPDYSYYEELLPGPGVEATKYTYGSVVIDIIDAESGQIIWRGSGEEKEYEYDYGLEFNQEEMLAIVREIREDVEKIIRHLPKAEKQ